MSDMTQMLLTQARGMAERNWEHVRGEIEEALLYASRPLILTEAESVMRNLRQSLEIMQGVRMRLAEIAVLEAVEKHEREESLKIGSARQAAGEGARG